MNTITECLQQRHEVAAKLVQSWYLTCGAGLGHDEDDQPVALVRTSESWDADAGTPEVVRWECRTCGAAADRIGLGVECR